MKSVKPLLAAVLLLSIPLFLITCTIEHDTPAPTDTVNWGYVKEYYTEKPIPNAMLVLYGKNPLWAVQDTLYTDSNGRYEFPLVKYLPELQASAPDYIGDRMYTQDELVGRFNRTIHLYQPAEMTMHVKNVRPFSGNIEVSLNDFIPAKRFNGNNIDTLICCLLARRYTTIDLQVVVRRNDQDSLFLVYHTPTQSHKNIIDIFY